MEKGQQSSAFTWGIILISLGVAFLLDEMNVIDFGELLSTFWPLIFIFLGIRMILNRGTSKKKEQGRLSDDAPHSGPSASLNKASFIGDLSLVGKSQHFTGGHATSMIGDIQVDLSQIDIAAGEHVMTINGLIGDVLVKVPARLKYGVRANVVWGDINVVGDTDGGILVSKTHHSDGYEQADGKLMLSISQFIGDVVVEEDSDKIAGSARSDDLEKSTAKTRKKRAPAKKSQTDKGAA